MTPGRLLAIFVTALVAAAQGAAGEETPPPDRRVIGTPGQGEGEDWRKARDRWIEERTRDRQEYIKERLEGRERGRGDEGAAPSRKPVFMPRVRANADISVIFPSGSILKGTPMDRGMSLSYRSDLETPPAAVMPRVEVDVDLGPMAGLGLDCAYHQLTGAGTVGAPRLYHGVTFPTGERIESRIGNLLAGGWIHYRFHTAPNATLWVRGGSRYLNQIAVLRRTVGGGKITETIDAFFPFLGARADFPVRPGMWLLVDVKLGYLWFGEDKYWQSNNMMDFDFHVAFRIFDRGRLTFGYGFFRLSARRRDRGVDEEIGLTYHALTASLRIRF
jgi:hypothetical protein